MAHVLTTGTAGVGCSVRLTLSKLYLKVTSTRIASTSECSKAIDRGMNGSYCLAHALTSQI